MMIFWVARKINNYYFLSSYNIGIFALNTICFSFRVRIPPKHVYYYRCPDHRKNYVMSFAFCFDREDDVYQFAYCYPYSYTRLQNYLDALEKKSYDFLSRELLCLSVVGNTRYLPIGQANDQRVCQLH